VIPAHGTLGGEAGEGLAIARENKEQRT